MGGRKSKRRGKSFELAVAKYLGMKRAHFQKHDLEGHPFITVECKKRETLPAAIKKWYAQAVAAVEPGKYPVVVMGELGGRTGDALALISVEDLRALMEYELSSLRWQKLAIESRGANAPLRI